MDNLPKVFIFSSKLRTKSSLSWPWRRQINTSIYFFSRLNLAGRHWPHSWLLASGMFQRVESMSIQGTSWFIFKVKYLYVYVQSCTLCTHLYTFMLFVHFVYISTFCTFLYTFFTLYTNRVVVLALNKIFRKYGLAPGKPLVFYLVRDQNGSTVAFNPWRSRPFKNSRWYWVKPIRFRLLEPFQPAKVWSF